MNVPVTLVADTTVNTFPSAGVQEPLSARLVPLKFTVPATLSWVYWLSTVVPFRAMFRGIPAAKLRVLSLLIVTSVPEPVGLIPVADELLSTVFEVKLTPGLIVTRPLVALPMLTVPPLTKASSAEFRFSGPPAGLVDTPRFTATPDVRG